MLTFVPALLIFSACLAIVFGITQRDQPRLMIRFAIYCFSFCVLGTIAASWLMDLIKR